MLDSRWSLCSGRPKAGPEYGNERSVWQRGTFYGRMIALPITLRAAMSFSARGVSAKG